MSIYPDIPMLTVDILVGRYFLAFSFRFCRYAISPLHPTGPCRHGLVHGQVQTKEITQRAQPERRTVGAGKGFLPETDLGDVL
jgi:hypothetical protein